MVSQPRQGEAKLKGVIKLQPGAQVQVQGLQNSKELNGLVGHLLEFDAVKLRWGVQLSDGSGKKVALKMQNLMPMSMDVEPAVEIPHVGPTPANATESGPPRDVTAEPAAAAAAGAATAEITVDSVEAVATAAEEQGVGVALSCVAAPVASLESKDKGGYTSVDASAPKKKPLLWEIPAVAEASAAEASAVEAGTAEEKKPAGKGKVCFGEEPSVETVEIPAVERAMAPPELAPGSQDEEWPLLPTSKEVTARVQTGCWWDGGSAAKRFTEQLRLNDPSLLSVVLVPPKRFNEEDAQEICDALEVNDICTELVASGHILTKESCERVAKMLQTTKTLQTLSIGEGTLGELACILFEGLAQNTSLTGLDLEHKGFTLDVCRSLASALESRKQLEGIAPLGSLQLSRNKAFSEALRENIRFDAPKELMLCECGLGPEHGKALGEWVSRGVEVLNLRDNPNFGGDGVESFLQALLPPQKKGSQTEAEPPVLRKLRLDGCAIGDDGLEMIAEAFKRGLQVEELSLERCEITLAGCQMLSRALPTRRLHTLSARANVIGDEGCILLAECAERLDLSSTNLSGQILGTLGKQRLVSLELFSNPSLGPSVGTWCADLDSNQWQQLEMLDLTGCALQDEGFKCVIKALSERLDLMPNLKDLMIGANDVTESEDMWELVDALGEARAGTLSTKWCNT